MSDQNESEEQVAKQVKRLKIPTRQGYSFVSVNDIMYCEADGNYTSIASGIEEKVTTSINLGKIEEELSDAKFFRINRSILINTNYYLRDNKTILLTFF